MLSSALIYLCAAVLSVPIAKRLGLGAVLGYLLAGVLIGPHLLHLVGEQTEVMHFAEFGVVMMLFLIGLELRPSRLWEMRRPILGLGGLQLILTAALIAFALSFIESLAWQTAAAIGLTLALSSTAIVIQSLTERGLLKTQAGNNAFAVLLFQDIAVIPILALLPLLAVGNGSTELSGGGHHGGWIHDLPAAARVGITFGTIAAIVIGGKYLASPMFRFIAETRLREIFTAFALLIVVAIATLMINIGLSPALGTFLAGVVLAESEFRHELEADIEPFKGLLLGLFFITVGANIDFPLMIEQPLLIGGAVLALLLAKAAVLALLATIFKMGYQHGLLFTLALAQGGEFAFVLVSVARESNVFSQHIGNVLIVVAALSMLISPLLILLYEKLFSRPGQKAQAEYDKEITPSCQIILAGYGRFGQVIGRLLTAQGHQLTILDHSPGQVEMVRRFGNTVFYGDASRKDLLAAAGAEDAQILIIAVDEADKTLDIIKTAQMHFPNLKILARAIDRRHTYELMRSGIAGLRRETFDSALNLGLDALKLMGRSAEQAQRAGELFRQHDEQSLKVLSELWGDDRSYGVAVRQRLEDLRQVLAADRQNTTASKQTASGSPPLNKQP
ncbi:Kef-type potassium/proton antiporter, CPA2 family [Spongiibacter sp. IMCC21906]|uniref:monovalent cation:proton antiporter-2 (CPA2) family protein n=1 Tax=Spongiibacter sp. IMCC21906 TaxID=1620392 RepID=UPI00062DF05A|nr:monovalent cation:proton antiporter-2 (CPA2) family protein [Spongiibacter sp. IMCC21906]AKH70232.1 Kef-type potassium/proton antiporter, CPA2 family [Spongiibacter sp. IMCC21906]